MLIAIHQPHYFPWLGYMAKMAEVDKFVLLDEVQLTDSSSMFRNKFCTSKGQEKYLSISFEKKDYMHKPFKDVKLNSCIEWQQHHLNFLRENYRKAPHYDQVYEKIHNIFERKYIYVCEVAIDSIMLIKEMLGISTEMLLQSEMQYDHEARKSDLVLSLCLSVGTNNYLSGNGARKYMNIDIFNQNCIDVHFQEFCHPIYSQISSSEFISNLSSLDLLFNNGIEESRKIFRNSINN